MSSSYCIKPSEHAGQKEDYRRLFKTNNSTSAVSWENLKKKILLPADVIPKYIYVTDLVSCSTYQPSTTFGDLNDKKKLEANQVRVVCRSGLLGMGIIYN